MREGKGLHALFHYIYPYLYCICNFTALRLHQESVCVFHVNKVTDVCQARPRAGRDLEMIRSEP